MPDLAALIRNEAFGDARTGAAPAAAIAQLALSDAVRRTQGEALDALGFGPRECGHEITACGPGWRLRAYGDGSGRPLLIVPAPIKRAYVWDLAPAVSVVRRLLDHGLGVHLLEWAPPARGAGEGDLDAHVEAIGAALAEVAPKSVARTSGAAAPILVGHSLGGTLAAVFAACDPHGPGGLVLLGSPLCFGERVSAFRDALASMTRVRLAEGTPVPGSMLTLASVLASPRTFLWSRLADLSASLADPEALEVHLRVARWALDEVPLPARLAGQILGWLYREDRFFRGALPVRGRVVGPGDLSTPTLAAVDLGDEIAPLAAVKPFLDAAPAASRLIEYPPETGVGLQHLAPLVGRRAHGVLWPQIIAWIDARR